MPASVSSQSKKRRKRTTTPRPEVIHDYYGKPLTATLARSHVVELFAKRPTWNRTALIKAVVEAHSHAGGIEGARSPMMCVNDALKGLKNAGFANNEVVGLWRLVGKLPATIKHDEQTLLEMEIGNAPFNDAGARPAIPPINASVANSHSPTLLETTEIGDGEESVSVLFNPNDQRLAAQRGATTGSAPSAAR